MTQYVGCETARKLLDGLVDGELTMNEQLAVESHLRWCRACNLRVQDMRLIGSSLRMSSAAPAVHRREDDVVVSAMSDALLMRVRAEREQSLGTRVREMFTDMRFFWPALGATMAVTLCATVAATVLQASTAESPESLAALIETLSRPGSEGNPLRPANNGISIPRLFADDAKRAGGTLDRLPEDDVIYTIRTVVSRDGRVSNFEVLLDGEPLAGRSAEHDDHARAVLDAVQQSRFAPAHTPLGRAVAVDMVWVIAKTTAVAGASERFVPPVPPVRAKAPAPKEEVAAPEEPEPVEPAAGENRQSGSNGDLTTA